MITDVPTPEDFKRSGLSFLNLAWTTVIDLLIHTEEEYSALRDDAPLTDEFWEAAQQPLANAASLIQQGVELLLKGRIAEVSPLLLIDGGARNWPRKSDLRDTPFADFRTIDAQDLIRTLNTVAPSRLDENFGDRVESIRRTRNAIMHTVDERLRIKPEALLTTILDISHHLAGPRAWVPIRRANLDDTPESVAYSTDYNEARLIKECDLLPRVLLPKDFALFFGRDTKQRWYSCPVCARELSDEGAIPLIAQLSPNTPTSTGLDCFVCGRIHVVVRRDCEDSGCKGNVIGSDGECLTCLS